MCMWGGQALSYMKLGYCNDVDLSHKTLRKMSWKHGTVYVLACMHRFTVCYGPLKAGSLKTVTALSNPKRSSLPNSYQLAGRWCRKPCRFVFLGGRLNSLTFVVHRGYKIFRSAKTRHQYCTSHNLIVSNDEIVALGVIAGHRGEDLTCRKAFVSPRC